MTRTLTTVRQTKKRADLPSARLVRAYERMYLIRIAEEKLADLYREKKIMSFVHFYIGQEAVAVGVADALEKKDKMLGNHRSHGHYLAKGGDLDKMVLELLGKQGGSSKGKGGSMHMIDDSVRFVGSTPILGSVVPLACGVAFEQKYRSKKEVSVGFLGDGAFEEGVVYETLNLAGLFRLPLLLVVENNLYSVNSPLHVRRAPGHSPETIVQGFGASYALADGLDYGDVYTKAAALLKDVRAGRGPAILECITYRHMAHSAPIFDESCRQEDVLDKRLERDAIKRLRTELLAAGVAEKRIRNIETAIAKKVDASLTAALSAPYPKSESLHTDLYV